MILIFTDLDGTLLNQDDYRYDRALPTIKELQRSNIPIIPVTSKTKAEVAELRDKIGLNAPFITENGSGIFFSPQEKRFRLPIMKTQDDRFYYHMLGFEYKQARIILQQMSATLKTNLIGFGDLSPEEICQLTGLSLDEGKLAKRRDFSEPFLTPNRKLISTDLLLEVASVYKCTIVIGDRFSHLIHHHSGKGNAVDWLLKNYQKTSEKIITIGLGNSPNDISLLKSVDIPIVIPGKKGIHSGLKHYNWRVAPTSGCEGWNLVIRQVVKELNQVCIN